MKQTERFNTLIEFEPELGLYRCEDIVKELDEELSVYLNGFDHDKLVERYDSEDKTYDIIMHCQLDSCSIAMIRGYLDACGIKGLYHIYNRLAN